MDRAGEIEMGSCGNYKKRFDPDFGFAHVHGEKTNLALTHLLLV